jgi:hypothetical protein
MSPSSSARAADAAPPPPTRSRQATPGSRRRRVGAVIAAGAVLLAGSVSALVPTGASASSHREAPLISGLPQLDNTDVYAFVSPDRPSMVTLIANWIPFEEPAGGPNFYLFDPEARYEVHIDNDGDAVADLTYRWEFTTRIRNGDTFLYNTGVVESFDDPTLNIRQTYDLSVIRDGRKQVMLRNAPVAPSRVGDASMPDYVDLREEAVVRIPTNRGSGQSFAGQAEDPFFLDLRVFDLLYGGDLSEVGNDTLAGYNVNSVALQVPKQALQQRATRDPVIGVWSTTSKKAANGSYVQVSRLGNPLVNEVVIPLKDKDVFNASEPAGDGQFLEYVVEPELPELIEAIYGIPAPETPRNDLVAVFLTGVEGLNQPENVVPSEQLRLNVDIRPSRSPDRLGVIGGDNAGFPNGRRLADDVVDIALQVVEGELVGNPNDLGDAVNKNDAKFGNRFPYLALPVSGSAVRPAPEPSSSGFTPLTGGAAPDEPMGPGLPALPIGAATLGALLVLGGLFAARRTRPLVSPAS